MKVILLQDVEDLGKKFDVKEVKDGHARNFLMPKKLVMAATKKNLKWLEVEKEKLAAQAEEDLKKVQHTASEIDGLEVNIPIAVGPAGQLFESVTSAKIAEQLKTMGFGIKKSQIQLEKPIKEAGEFPVKVTLDHNLETEIKIIVSGESKGETSDEVV